MKENRYSCTTNFRVTGRVISYLKLTAVMSPLDDVEHIPATLLYRIVTMFTEKFFYSLPNQSLDDTCLMIHCPS